ncbi:LOW QUALITY PROTEIN: hypothetical protein PanWU01x14_093870 [Parasponia andersonii]|uniref:Uncharacterized protein n=1 Tax=Parasponia andersonii TaxID=3476 RepID=A0A2P5D666_PARAD|nr:LOW QUALITY PROTEIN: hypothetical protein PanWU01x14_093870 [Parasponia andersonii]
MRSQDETFPQNSLKLRNGPLKLFYGLNLSLAFTPKPIKPFLRQIRLKIQQTRHKRFAFQQFSSKSRSHFSFSARHRISGPDIFRIC